MALHKNKVAQALIQGAIEVIDKVQEADALLDDFVAKFDAKGISLNGGTNITTAQLAQLRTFKTDLNALATGNVATTIKSKDHPSHGTDALS